MGDLLPAYKGKEKNYTSKRRMKLFFNYFYGSFKLTITMTKKKDNWPRGFSLYKKHLRLTDDEAEFLSNYIIKVDIKATQLIRKLLREFMDNELKPKRK